MFKDLQYALRQLRKSPGFSLTVIFTLALSVGLSTAVYSVIDAVILRPLPFAQPEKIVAIAGTSRSGYSQPESWPSYADKRAQARSYQALAAYQGYGRMTMESPTGAPVRIAVTSSTDNFFDVFGVRPLLGRTYLPGEEQDGKNQIVVLGYEAWKMYLSGDPQIVGKTIKLNGEDYSVIGVMPESFRFPLGKQSQIYTPRLFTSTNAEYRTARGSMWLNMVGRLRDGVSISQAQAEMTEIAGNLGRAYPGNDGGKVERVQLLSDSLNSESRKPLWVLLGAVLAVLAIGCVNVAGLLLARGVQREREMAMRVAIGAGRFRLVRQVLTESLVLALAGALASLLCAALLLRGLRVFLVAALARGSEVQMNWQVLAVAILLATVASLLAALYPALRMSGVDPNSALKAGGRGGVSRAQNRLRSSFIVGQVALTLTLLIVSGLLLRAVTHYRHEEMGFDPQHILSTPVNLSPVRYAQHDLMSSFYRPLEERVRQIPGVRAAGIISVMPIESSGMNFEAHIVGQPPYPKGQERLAEMRFVDEGYYGVFGVQLKQGRWLSSAIDRPESKTPAVMVNEAFVRKFIPPGADTLGQKIDGCGDNVTIAGVSTNVRQNVFDQPYAEVDFLADSLSLSDQLHLLHGAQLVVRFDGDGKALTPALREAIREIDPTVPFKTPTLMDAVIDDALSMDRLENWLFGIFAGLALLMALVGLYGLISHEVEQGRREIGIRLALGALRQSVLRMVLDHVAVLLALGTTLGLGLTYVLRKLIGTVIYLNAQKQAGVFVGVALLMLGAGLLVALVPGLRAASVEPNEALRSE